MSTVYEKDSGRSKVAILTFQRAINYGAALQAYALQRVISEMGYQCELLDLDRPAKPAPKRSWLASYRRKTGEPLGQQISWALGALGVRVRGRLVGMLLDQLRRPSFREFERNHMRFSPRRYRSITALKDTSLDYAAYVAGSDQVWNPEFPWDPEPYFLTFAPPGAIRIAYAASFGVNLIEGAVRDSYNRWLKGFDAISVREDVGERLVVDLSGCSASLVLDPTFLLEHSEWAALAQPTNLSRPYVFCYNLRDSAETDIAAIKLGRLLGLPVVRLGSSLAAPQRGVQQLAIAGPARFISLIQGANLVVTNSFHGMAFAINLGRPFYSILNTKDNMNSRMISLLKMLELPDRTYDPAGRYCPEVVLDTPGAEVQCRLRIMRGQSREFLASALRLPKQRGD